MRRILTAAMAIVIFGGAYGGTAFASPAAVEKPIVEKSSPCTPWPATDALGRRLPTSDEVGPPRADRFVGIFYFLTHQTYPKQPNGQPYDISKIYAVDPDAAKKPNSPLWGPIGMVHYWGEPLFGYYRGDDPWVLRRHAHLLADAGIDTLIFDTTNAVTYRNIYMKLCEVFSQIHREGGRTPRIAFMVNTKAGQTAQEIYNDLYKPGLYRELWFYWRGKPLLICDPKQATPELKAFFTLRRAHWPMTMVNTPYAWHWEATYPQPYGYTDDPEKPEQVNVAVAQNLRQADGKVTWMSAGNARGRSFHDGREDTSPDAILHGYNFEEQWRRAFDLKPPFVMVTGWNEWVAGRMDVKKHPLDPLGFCDQFDAEFSRDIEPVRGGHGDNYYWQLIANVRRFKGCLPIPKASRPKTIDLAGGFEQWRDVAPEFCDHVGDTSSRDFRGTTGQHYVDRSGRNDFVAMKVARDSENIYFYARTREPITLHTDKPWMQLLIDVDQSAKTGWQGFDFVVNRTVESGDTAWLERWNAAGRWEKVVRVRLRVVGNELQLAVPRTALGLAPKTSRLALDFKWADNIDLSGDILQFYTTGDVAPDGRFVFRFDGR